MRIRLGSTARSIRERIGLSQREAAKRLGVTPVHLCNIERDHSVPSNDLLERFREVYGVDLYVYAWCKSGDMKRLPLKLRRVSAQLTELWDEDIERTLAKKGPTP